MPERFVRSGFAFADVRIADGWIYDRVMICSFISFLFLSLSFSLHPKASSHHVVQDCFGASMVAFILEFFDYCVVVIDV